MGRYAHLGRISAIVMGLSAVMHVSAQGETDALTEDDLRWRKTIGFNPQVHGAVTSTSDANVFGRVPYAYYPYAGELEVAFDLAAAIQRLPTNAPPPTGDVRKVLVRVLPAVIPTDRMAAMPFHYAAGEPADSGSVVASGSIPLDARGRGHGIIKMPKLAVGNYRVEYEFGGTTLTAAKTIRRTHFEWEGCDYGNEHKVYPPFTPVEVDGDKVSVVGRTYTVNNLGLFDSVVSQGRELLAEPMNLVIETDEGQRVQWKGGAWFSDGIRGRAAHPDLALFETRAEAVRPAASSSDDPRLTVLSRLAIEEDGCARVTMTLTPDARRPAPVRRAWLEIAMKESEAPLCHLVGMNSMRHNYAGHVPRGGEVLWINQFWRPARFDVKPFEGDPPASYEVWDATKNMHWGGERWIFAPYVWMGAEERGLAWFGDHIGGYEPEGLRGIQRLSIEPGRVVLRVELIQKPVTLDAPRTFEFGIQASPTKPMRPDWRTHSVPGGGGMSVVVWGGFICADKMPANGDWSIVDKILEGAVTGKADPDWFASYARTNFTFINEGGGSGPGVIRRVPLEQAKANDQPWLTSVDHFARRAAELRPGQGITVYYEEHQTSGAYPEVSEFTDEWGDLSFSRYRYFDHPLTWGPEIRTANAPSYRDFAVFYANEWMRRGVGIYYDNTFPMVDRNRHRLAQRGLAWSSSIWGHREYYKRVWKRSRALMASGESPRPLHTVGHVTNCQVLPYTGWWDATLGGEQAGHWLPDTMPTPLQSGLDQWGFMIVEAPSRGQPGQALPYPPDYLRAMECGRMAGVIPHYCHPLRGPDAFLPGIGLPAKTPSSVVSRRQLSDKAMGMVHEIRGGFSDWDNSDILTLQSSFNAFRRLGVTVHNYWEENPFVTLDHPNVKWIALERTHRPTQSSDTKATPSPPSAVGDAAAPSGGHPMSDAFLLLLQSYEAGATQASIALPRDAAMLDLFTRRLLPPGQPIDFPSDYGTRLLLVAADAADLRHLAWPDGVILQADFELGLPPGGRMFGEDTPRIVQDPTAPDRGILRVKPGNPSSQYALIGATHGDYRMTFRFRLPEIKARPPYPEFYGFLQALHRHVDSWPKASGQTLALGIERDPSGKAALAMTYGNLRAGEQAVFDRVSVDRLKEVGGLVPLDTDWHTVGIEVQGQQHSLSLDGTEVFRAETDVSKGGRLVIGPGWWSGWWSSNWPAPHVDVDDLVVRKVNP